MKRSRSPTSSKSPKKARRSPKENKNHRVFEDLCRLLHSNCHSRRCKLQKAPDEVIHCINECAHNYLKGRIPDIKGNKGQQFAKLAEGEKTLRYVVAAKSHGAKRHLLVQRGSGIIGPLLSVALPLLLTLFGKK